MDRSSGHTQTNYLVLGALLEARYQMPYRQIVKPLGLRNTYFGKGHVSPEKVVQRYRGKDDPRAQATKFLATLPSTAAPKAVARPQSLLSPAPALW